jgi:UDP-N-acetylmuramyl pentapeptide phosphotransferase/UDP-N-acetylglucosamine-1-phosphate transferase
MGDIGSFTIGGIVGIIVSAVGLEKVILIMKETITEAIPVLLTFVEGII